MNSFSQEANLRSVHCIRAGRSGGRDVTKAKYLLPEPPAEKAAASRNKPRLRRHERKQFC